MADDSKKNKALHIILFIFAVATVVGYGGFMYYEYAKNKKIDATVVTPEQALSIIQQGLQNG